MCYELDYRATLIFWSEKAAVILNTQRISAISRIYIYMKALNRKLSDDQCREAHKRIELHLFGCPFVFRTQQEVCHEV